MARGDKRNDILRAAEHVIQNRRYHEIKLDDIAKAAAVGKGTLYLYFKDKEELFFQLLMEAFDALYAVVQRIVESKRPFQDKLAETMEAMTDFMDRRHRLVHFMFDEERRRAALDGRHKPDPRFVAHRTCLHKAHEDLMRQGVREGVLRKDIPPMVMAHFMMGIIHSRQVMRKTTKTAVPVAQMVNFFSQGAAKRTAGKS
ncbi:MAG: TetR/AcrR family transcriptional regulator [Lentisphaerota bacterium]